MSDNQQNISVSKAIDILRFPLAVFVVAIHTYFNEGLKARGNVDVPFSGVWAHEFIRFFSITLTDCAVPMFFVISGFLYFWKTPHLTKDIYRSKTKKKIIALMVPFFCWNVITCLINPARFLSAGVLEKITGFWSMTMELGCGAGPWDGPLWFVRDLFIVMLCTPAVEWIVGKAKLGGVFVLYVPVLMGYDSIVPGLSVRSFLFFMLGASLAIHHQYVLHSIRLKYTLPIGLVFMALRSFHIGGNIFAECWILASMAMYFALARKIGEQTQNMIIWKRLSAASFVIYAMHRLINSKISAFGLMLIGKESLTGGEAVALYIATILTTVGVCYVADVIISHCKMLSFLLKGAR